MRLVSEGAGRAVACWPDEDGQGADGAAALRRKKAMTEERSSRARKHCRSAQRSRRAKQTSCPPGDVKHKGRAGEAERRLITLSTATTRGICPGRRAKRVEPDTVIETDRTRSSMRSRVRRVPEKSKAEPVRVHFVTKPGSCVRPDAEVAKRASIRRPERSVCAETCRRSSLCVLCPNAWCLPACACL